MGIGTVVGVQHINIHCMMKRKENVKFLIIIENWSLISKRKSGWEE